VEIGVILRFAPEPAATALALTGATVKPKFGGVKSNDTMLKLFIFGCGLVNPEGGEGGDQNIYAGDVNDLTNSSLKPPIAPVGVLLNTLKLNVALYLSPGVYDMLVGGNT
jgi:hypothetical protein